jgi:hypothetical protein
MDGFMNNYFGPLGKEYCTYFYVLSVIFGFTFLFSAVSIAYFIVMHHKKVDASFVINSFFVLFNSFLAYLVNRIMNTMCVKTL